jgi:hypothetical protein
LQPHIIAIQMATRTGEIAYIAYLEKLRRGDASACGWCDIIMFGIYIYSHTAARQVFSVRRGTAKSRWPKVTPHLRSVRRLPGYAAVRGFVRTKFA